MKTAAAEALVLGLKGTPEQRVHAAIELGRMSEKFGNRLDFDACQWEVTEHVPRRAGVPARMGRLYINFEEPNHRGEPTDPPTETGLLTRAFLRLDPARAGFTALVHMTVAGRLVSAALLERGQKTIVACNIAILNRAVELAAGRGGRSYCFQLACCIECFARFLAANGMTRAGISGWRPSVSKSSLPDPGAPEAARRAARLMPSEEALELLPLAFDLASETADVIVTRLAILASFAPERFNEVLALSVDPEVERMLGNQACLGLRWVGSKGFNDGVKWIPSRASSLTRESFDDLRWCTENGRRIKAWYNMNPTTVFLPSHLEHLRGKERLSVEEVGALLGRKPGCGLHNYLRHKDLELLSPVGDLVAPGHNLSFTMVERLILGWLPDAMRDSGGPDSHPLLLVEAGTFHRGKATPCPCMFEPVRYRQVAAALSLVPGLRTVFQRLGLDPEGRVSLKLHQLRHWSHTTAKRGGLSDTAAATWAGRVDTRANRHYDHRTGEDMRRLAGRGNPRSARTTSPLARPSKTPRRDPDAT